MQFKVFIQSIFNNVFSLPQLFPDPAYLSLYPSSCSFHPSFSLSLSLKCSCLGWIKLKVLRSAGEVGQWLRVLATLVDAQVQFLASKQLIAGFNAISNLFQLLRALHISHM